MRLSKISLAPQGGMQDTPATVPPGLADQLVNAFPRAGSWVWRAGTRLTHATPYTDRLSGAMALKTTGAGQATVEFLAASAGTLTTPARFLRQIGTALVPIPFNGVLGPQFDARDFWRAWRWISVNDSVTYACRRAYKADGVLYNVTKDQATAAGIPAPAAAPVVTNDATASSLAGGVYPVAYRYVTSDGQPSPMSPAALSAAITANQSRAWAVVASTHPRVTGIELFAGFAGGGETVVFRATTVPNVTGSYIEGTLDSEYDEVSGNFSLVGPPDGPEEVFKWDARLWVVSNEPRPLFWPSYIDENGATYETFDPQEAIELPVGGGRRYMGGGGWDRGRAVALTDSSVHVIQPGSGTSYTITDVDLDHGCVSAAAWAVGQGLLVWFDGRNILASDGGPARIISVGWMDKALSQIPAAYADHAIVFYTPDDGGAFWIVFPSTSSSTENDLAACWDGKNWHKRSWNGNTKAPTFLARIPSDDAQWITVGSFAGIFRVLRLDSPTRRDEGPYNILVRIITGEVPIPDGYATCSVARVHVGIRRRADTATPDPGAPMTASVSLRLNEDTDTTPVSATRVAGTQYLHARAHNLQRPAEQVQVILDFDVSDTLEVFDVVVEAVFFKREGGRT